ncbi:hypothetical protein Tco_0262558 [Tanacetum coccineum]|uniref:Uncharacterized protein n=1 Tax=Tanacetum coccineum TaxID=301880 RepID=A0ABQ4YMP3_9ASTR
MILWLSPCELRFHLLCGVSQKSLVNHCLDGFWSHVVWVGVVNRVILSSSGLRESLPSVPDAYEYPATIAVSGVPGDRSRVHTDDHDGSEAPDELPNSILSSKTKPFKKHRPPLPPSILSPGESSCPP